MEYEYKITFDIEKMHSLNAKKIAEIVGKYKSQKFPINIQFKRPNGEFYEGDLVLDLIYNCYRDRALEVIVRGDLSQKEEIKTAGEKIKKFALTDNKKTKIVLKDFRERLITG